MADDIRQWEFGGNSPSGNQGGDSGTGNDNQRRKKEKEKSPEEKVDDARKKVEDTQRKLKRAKEEIQKTPKRVKQLKETAEKATRAAKQAGEATARAARTGAEAAKPVVEAGRQAATQAAIRIAEIAARVAAQVAEKTAQIASKVAQVAVKLLTNPYVLAAVLIILIVMLLFNIFMGSVNQVSSLAGGSIFVPADHNNPVHQQIVSRLKQKMEGCDPKLVVYSGGIQDIDWQVDPDTGSYSHALDIRLLKTLDYLTDQHQRIVVDLLKTGSPEIIRDSFLKKKVQYSKTGQDEVEQKETLSAFSTGQAMAIVEIDRSKIPELQSADIACNAPVPAPIEVRWQRTVGEKTIRPIWEELAYSVGFLDQNVGIYQAISARNDEEAILRLARAYKLSEPVDGAYDVYKETFRKLPRIITLIDRALEYGEKNFESKQALDPVALARLQKARENYAPLVDLVGGINVAMSDEEVADKIAKLGQAENIARLRTGAQFAYGAMNVKNSVNWTKRKKNGDLTYVKADESRNKIRQVEKELKEMPRETSLSGAPMIFDESLIVKQIITFSPEDDLDNGLENIDIFPRGLVSVDNGGVAFETLSFDPETGAMIGDGVVDAADNHFSHAPVDNGIFSKNGTNYVYKKVTPDDSAWKKAGEFIWTYLTLPGQISSANDKLHDLMVGGCVAGVNDDCRKVSYRDFLHVSF